LVHISWIIFLLEFKNTENKKRKKKISSLVVVVKMKPGKI